MHKEMEQQQMIETLKGARVVDFITPVLRTYTKLEMVKQDAKHDKAAKAYLESVEQEYRNQLKFLYEAANQAFPEDKVDPRIAHSSLGPADILEHYEFSVIVRKKT